MNLAIQQNRQFAMELIGGVWQISLSQRTKPGCTLWIKPERNCRVPVLILCRRCVGQIFSCHGQFWRIMMDQVLSDHHRFAGLFINPLNFSNGMSAVDVGFAFDHIPP